MKNNSGMTLVEVLIAVAILVTIIPVMVTLIDTTMKGFTSFDASQQIKTANQKLLNNIYGNLSQSKRVFQNTTDDLAFLARISSTGRPALLTNSKLPVILSTGTLSPGDSTFDRSKVGNSLFFASQTDPSSFANVMGSTSSVTIDVYKFYYYYLTSEYTARIYTANSYNVYRWQSVKYADYNQLNSITDATKKSNTIKALYAANILYAWDPSVTSVSTAFYTLAAAGTIASSSGHNLVQDSTNSKLTIKLITGSIGGGFKYGIAPNSNTWTKSPKTVPLYATAATSFPCGFEVAITGSSGGREALIRSVIVAQGSMKTIPANDQSIVVSVKDLW